MAGYHPGSDVIIVMGVCGCGKTTVGEALAEELDAVFVEGDSVHPKANREKMERGEALTDDDRWPWLDALAKQALGCILDSSGLPVTPVVVLAASCLARKYRDRIRSHRGLAGVARVSFVHLEIDQDTASARVAARGTNHFMPESLVPSQFEVLEELEEDEYGVTIDARLSDPPTLILSILSSLSIPSLLS